MENESSLSFPCLFPIKVIGRADLSFISEVLSIFRAHVPDLGEGAVQERYSDHNTYLSLTVTVMATSQSQLDAIYLALSHHRSVIMAL